MEKEFKVCEVTPKYVRTSVNQGKITSSKNAYEYLMKLVDLDTIEYLEKFYILHLNRNNEITAFQVASSGGISGVDVDAKVILSMALNVGASAMFLAHNHPSGRLQPSSSDMRITAKLKEAAKLLDIVVIDHLILTKEEYYSFADEGIL